MARIALLQSKGGVGKTRTAVELATGLARGAKATAGRPGRRAYRTLLLDLDPQGSATFALGIGQQPGRDAFALVTNPEAEVKDVVEPTYQSGLDIIPGSLNLIGAALGSFRIDHLAVLAKLERASADYEVIVIDCPNALAGQVAVLSMVLAHEFIVPVSPRMMDVRGLQVLIRLIEAMTGIVEQLGAQNGQPLRFPDRLGTLLTIYDTRGGNTVKQFAQSLRALPIGVYGTEMRKYAAVEVAAAASKSVVDVDPASKAADDVERFVNETIGLLQQKGYRV